MDVAMDLSSFPYGTKLLIKRTFPDSFMRASEFV